MAFKQLVTPNFGATDYAGNCLPMAQKVVGADGGPYSATAAANATQYQHWGRNLPSDSIAVLWFSHYGTYTDYRNGERRWEDWGHVVIWSPSAFGAGRGGFYSSPRNGYGGEWFSSIAEVEASFSSAYRFWSEDINGVRVTQPGKGTASATTKPVVVQEWEDTLKAFKGISKRKPQTLKGGQKQYITFLDSHDDSKFGNRTLARGPGTVAGLTVNLRLKGKPGTRVQFELVVETAENEGRQVIAEPRGTIDSYGLLSLQLSTSTYLSERQLVRVLAQPEAGQNVVVEKFYWSGLARPGV